ATQTDPRGIVAKSTFDLLGRATQVVSAYDGGSVTASTNQTVQYTFNGDDEVLTQTVVMPTGTPNQITQYDYGVQTSDRTIEGVVRPASDFFSNDLLFMVRYPDHA